MKLEELYRIIKDRQEKMPAGSYTASLFSEGEDRIIQKVGEEAIETVIAAKGNKRQRLISELADLYFHLLVLMAKKEIKPEEIFDELEKRHKKIIRQLY